MQPLAGYTDREATVRGLRFHYLAWGKPDAPPMVLLHGLTGHAHTWDHMAPALAERYHVLAPDQRGHGDTQHAPSYATDDFVEDTAALIADWAIGPFVLLGLSMGGHNALAFAGAHPELVSRLVVIDIPPALRREQAPNWGVISKLAETGHTPFSTFDQAVEAARAGNPTAPEENLRYRTRWNLNEVSGGKLVLKYDPKAPATWEPSNLWDVLPTITAPTLLVRGGKTTVLPRDVAERMMGSISDAELVEVADSGHSVPTDRPEALQRIVLDWLERRA